VGDNSTSAGNQQERLSSEERRRWFLAGVIEGEGSFCISIKKHPTTALGFYVQPCFFLYQHESRRPLLEMAREQFQAGAIYPKPGNPAVLVFAINSRRAVSQRVVPFLKQYMEFSARREDMERYLEVVDLLERGVHREPEGLARIVRIAYAMNMDGKQRVRTLDELLDRILRGHTPDIPGRDEEMVRPPRRRGELGGTETT
jgi:LAGLIDADG endonuclease